MRFNGPPNAELQRARDVIDRGSVAAHRDGPAKGSQFVVRLPIPIPAIEPRPKHDAGLMPAPARRRILVVDDNNDCLSAVTWEDSEVGTVRNDWLFKEAGNDAL